MTDSTPERKASPEETSAYIRSKLAKAAWIEEIDPSINQGTISTEQLAKNLGVEEELNEI